MALAVDAVKGLVEIAGAGIETRQAKLAALPGELLAGAFQASKDGPVVKVLDVKALLSATFVTRERSARRQIHKAENTGVTDLTGAQSKRAKFVAFALAGQDYALPLEDVHDILTAPSLMANVPHSEALVLGVKTLRERLLPLLSLRGLLGFGPNADPQKEKIIVASIQGNIVGLVADEMRDIFSADEDRLDPIPEVLAARTGGESRIISIYRGNGDRGLVSILSSEQIFGDDVMRKLMNTTKAVESTNGTGMADGENRQYLVFRLGDEEYGLPIEAVEEVARVPDKISRVPNTPKFLEGVVNLRGEVIPVVDQRKRFQMSTHDGSTGRRLVVIRTEQHIAGLIVDSVSEVLRASVDDIDAAPDLTGRVLNLSWEWSISMPFGGSFCCLTLPSF